MSSQNSQRAKTPDPDPSLEPTEATIAALVQQCLPETHPSLEITKLPLGERYNNLLYRISTAHQTSSARDEEYMLKVRNPELGPDKVENEVLSLLLLQQKCPDIPSPRVIAWSEHGSAVHRVDADGIPASTSPRDAERGGDLPGWILMTCLPGDPLDLEAFSEEDRRHVASQVADLLASLRANVPVSHR